MVTEILCSVSVPPSPLSPPQTQLSAWPVPPSKPCAGQTGSGASKTGSGASLPPPGLLVKVDVSSSKDLGWRIVDGALMCGPEPWTCEK